MTDLARLRTLHGRSTAVWVGDGVHEVAADHWLALSGAPHADYNLALCHGPDSPVAAVRDRLTAGRRPAILALAGGTPTAPLLEAGWREVGSAPLMMATAAGESDPAARLLTAADLPAARALVATVYGLDEGLAQVAVREGAPVWGLVEDGLKSCLVAARVEDAVVVWSMATDPTARRQGYGRRLLTAVHHAAARDGAQISLLHASAAGEPFYLSTGYEVRERWAFWSRPRWVLASGAHG